MPKPRLPALTGRGFARVCHHAWLLRVFDSREDGSYKLQVTNNTRGKMKSHSGLHFQSSNLGSLLHNPVADCVILAKSELGRLWIYRAPLAYTAFQQI